jgi:O-acetylserine/cysteine efflux transporter
MITRLPLAALIIASLFWGTAVSVTKYALRGFGPITLLAISLIAGTAMLWTVVILRGHRPAPRWRRAVLLGLFEPALAYAGDLLGLARTSAANGALLSGLESVFIVLLAAVFLGERITGRIAAAVALALAGVMALEGTGSFSGAGLGDLLVLAGVLSAAAYTIVARGMGDEFDPLTVTAYQFAAATILVVPAATFVWATHAETVPSHVAARFWLAAVLLGVIGYAASFLLYNYAIARVRAAPASIIVNLIPVFGLASAVCWLGDSLTAGRIFGAILIGLSVTIFTAIELGEVRRAARAAERDAAETPAPQPSPSAGAHLIAAGQWSAARPSWASGPAKIGNACPCAVCARLPTLAFSAPVPVGRQRR